jgi:hypothetical protein
MQPDGFWQDVLLMAFDNRKDGDHASLLPWVIAELISSIFILSQASGGIAREAGFSGNLRFFAIIVRLP